MTNEQQFDKMILDFVRGAALQEMQDATINGIGESFMSESAIMNRTLAGLDDGSITPISKREFDSEVEKLLYSPQMAGFFKKVARSVQKVRKAGHKLLPKKAQAVMKKVDAKVKKVAKKLKPFIVKIVKIVAIVVAIYFGAIYAAKAISAIKAGMVSSTAKKVALSKALEAAKKAKRPPSEIAMLEKEYAVESSKAAMEQSNGRAMDLMINNPNIPDAQKERYLENPIYKAYKASEPEVKAFLQQTAPAALKALAQKRATEMAAQEGVNLNSPEAQKIVSEGIDIEFKKIGQPTGEEPKKAAAFAIPLAAGLLLLAA